MINRRVIGQLAQSESQYVCNLKRLAEETKMPVLGDDLM